MRRALRAFETFGLPVPAPAFGPQSEHQASGRICQPPDAAAGTLGYAAGQTVDIDYRYAEGDTARLKPLMHELIALKPDVALANSPSPALALKSVAPALPIVCPQLSDSVMPGLAASYARPGGNITGSVQYGYGTLGFRGSQDRLGGLWSGAHRIHSVMPPEGCPS
jgi:hypothetical protein